MKHCTSVKMAMDMKSNVQQKHIHRHRPDAICTYTNRHKRSGGQMCLISRLRVGMPTASKLSSWASWVC